MYGSYIRVKVSFMNISDTHQCNLWSWWETSSTWKINEWSANITHYLCSINTSSVKKIAINAPMTESISWWEMRVDYTKGFDFFFFFLEPMLLFTTYRLIILIPNYIKFQSSMHRFRVKAAAGASEHIKMKTAEQRYFLFCSALTQSCPADFPGLQRWWNVYPHLSAIMLNMVWQSKFVVPFYLILINLGFLFKWKH